MAKARAMRCQWSFFPKSFEIDEQLQARTQADSILKQLIDLDLDRDPNLLDFGQKFFEERLEPNAGPATLPFDWDLDLGNRGAIPEGRVSFTDCLDELETFWYRCKLEILKTQSSVLRKQDRARNRINQLVNDSRMALKLKEIPRVTTITQYFQPRARDRAETSHSDVLPRSANTDNNPVDLTEEL